MKISMHTMSVEAFVPTLTGLGKILDKAAQHASAKKFDPAVLVNARLAPDMFPLAKQVQIACDFAKGAAARLTGQEAPKFEDNEQTIDELKARVARTLDYVKGFGPAAFEGAEDRDIKLSFPNGMSLEFKGLAFLRDWALPNFYFHAVTAYDILRHNGIEIGKRDYLNSN
ncbi:MAG TPA: DUF1993 domain-containing protein [Steroidobacteraceae bacterium]|nr:DUF1993 domain-containing protein [Steroidobacteraceae bacterium]